MAAGGTPTDEPVVLALFDEAVAWLVARGQTGQWGSEPPSSRPDRRALVRRMAAGTGLRVAQDAGGAPLASVVVGAAPSSVAPCGREELYIELLLTSRARAGEGLGSALVAEAASIGRDQGAEVLRVDCWAGAPGLVRWYERQGFDRDGTFDLDGWPGQIFVMEL